MNDAEAPPPGRLSILPLRDIAASLDRLLPPATVCAPACLAHTNLPDFDWEFGRHLMKNLYVPRVCRLDEVRLWRLPPGAFVAVPNGEELLAVHDQSVAAEQIHPGWDTARLHEAIAGCANEGYIDRSTVLIGRYGLRTWGHWLGELLPKIVCVEACHPGRCGYALPIDIVRDPHLATALESLTFHGIGRDRLVLLEPGCRYRFRELLAVSPVWSDRMIHPGAVEAMRRTAPALPPAGRVALLRRESTTRRVANLDQLHPVLAANGFRIVEIGAMSFRAQVAIFQGATAIVSVLGSGLSGLIYAPPKVKIAALCPIGWADDFFFAMMRNRAAALADIRGPSTDDDSRGAAVSSFTVDPAALERGLRALGLCG